MLGKFLKNHEDHLTAAVIGHLLHLPADRFWQIIKASSNGSLPPFSGEIESHEYWPHWDPTDTRNEQYVEPDVFIRYEKFDLIIEAKRWDGQGQKIDQWKSEFQAYKNEYGEEKKKVYLLALGGNTGSNLEGKDIVKCSWYALLHECKKALGELSKLEHNYQYVSAQIRILQDIIPIFASFGFATGRWFEEFDFFKNYLNNGESAQKVFHGIAPQFELQRHFWGRRFRDFDFNINKLLDPEQSQQLFRGIQGEFNHG